MPKCYAYGRHSTDKQGMTREVQERACRDYYDTHLAKKGIEWVDFFYDSAVSGGKLFSEREYGRQVYFSLQRGDYLLVASMDRLFRSKVDGFVTLDQLDRKGIKRVVLDLPDLSGLEGDAELYDMLESNMVLYAHMYRRMLSRKMKRDNAAKKEAGLPYCRTAPIGWRVVGTRQSKAYRVDPHERKYVDFMQTLADEGMSAEAIACWCYRQKEFAVKPGRRFTHPSYVRWALRARLAGYPMIASQEEFARKWASGEIALGCT
jgi:DNA invertase Pin-like site-specific DNA recombinase